MQFARLALAVSLLLVAAVAVGVFVMFIQGATDSRNSTRGKTPLANSNSASSDEAVDRFFANRNLTVWWDRDEIPGKVTTKLAAKQTSSIVASNIHPEDYVGPEACQKCHRKKYDSWSHHSHRWMNALATPESVLGDFTGVTIQYLGGEAKFVEPSEGQYAMILKRDGVERQYEITQTIGRRFFQYYVGRLVKGPEPASHLARQVDHVMLFGYWLDRKEWVPAVHVGYDELPDGQREDPFARTLPVAPRSPYFQCNSCHTTFALGDELTRNFYSLGRHAPYALHWHMPGYLKDTRKESMPPSSPRQTPNEQVEALLVGMQQFEAPEEAVTLGVSCEACHLGCKSHVADQSRKPAFFPVSRHLHAETSNLPLGRESVNVNWACGRCHAGERPYYEGGMATWNSTEYTDATKGGCYSELTCIDCHDPHQAIGSKWSKTTAQDDASCLKCHEEFKETTALTAHTHHAADGEGSRLHELPHATH